MLLLQSLHSDNVSAYVCVIYKDVLVCNVLCFCVSHIPLAGGACSLGGWCMFPWWVGGWVGGISRRYMRVRS